MIIKKAFAYKVKYYAHKMFHGSMQEHYNKLGRYLQTPEEYKLRHLYVIDD